MRPAWRCQLTAASLPPLSHLCQLTAVKLPQDNSTQPTHWGTTPCGQPEGQTGKQADRQSAEWQWRPEPSHFHISWHAAATVAKLWAKEAGDGSSDGGV